MARPMCLAVAWLVVCALAGPATPVAEGPAPLARVESLEAVPIESVPEADPQVTEAPGEAPLGEEAPIPPAPVEDEGSPSGTAATAPVPKPRTEERPVEADASPTARPAQVGAVTVEDFSFGPATVTIGVGESVTWINSGPSEHTATASDGSFDTGILAEGESASHRFDAAGTFSYLCTPHPFMKGAVRVVAQAAAVQPADDAPEQEEAGVDQVSPEGRELPRTGSSAGWMLLAGAGLLLIGTVGRRGTRHPREPLRKPVPDL